MDIRQETILLTGGAGFIGSHIVDAYIKEGHKVIIIDNLSTGKKENINKNAQFFNLDITNRKELKKIVSEKKPTIISHHAAQISVNFSLEKPIIDAQINIIGLLNLLDSIKNEKIKKII